MTKSPWTIQPNPLDYVPADRLESPTKHKPTEWDQPSGAKRGAIAAGWLLALAAGGFILAVAFGAL